MNRILCPILAYERYEAGPIFSNISNICEQLYSSKHKSKRDFQWFQLVKDASSFNTGLMKSYNGNMVFFVWSLYRNRWSYTVLIRREGWAKVN